MNLRVFYLTRRGLSDGYGKSADKRKNIASASAPMPFGERHPVCSRVCSQTRSPLLPDAFVSAPAFADKHRCAKTGNVKCWRQHPRSGDLR